jgi:Fe-S cluster assembly protein SufD
MGLPQRRDEYWRFTDPSALTSPDVADGGPGGAEAFADMPALRLAFLGGAFACSDGPRAPGVEVSRLAEAGEGHWAASLPRHGRGGGPRPRAAHAGRAQHGDRA